MVLVLFSDFQCNFCGKEAQMLRENLLKTYPEQVRLYFKDFPLEKIHPWAKTASIAGRKEYLPDKLVRALDAEPIVLPAWDPMGSLA